MKANDTLMIKFLEGSKQFVVPLYQRTYSWDVTRIATLWEDIEGVKNGEEAVHFLGPFVTEPISSSASEVSKYLVIDGQQRLVTTFLFLTALKDRIKELDPKHKLIDEINDLYLTNKYHPEEKYKLVPTQADRQLFFDLVDGKTSSYQEYNLIMYAIAFFKEKLSTINDLTELTILKNIVLNKFSSVDIRLELGDNPHLIFESLNATGTKLTQTDLIRNYLFMRIEQGHQEQIYKDVWFPLQQRLGDYLQNFARHYLAMNGIVPNIERVYTTFKEDAESKAKNEVQVVALMSRLGDFGEYYEKFLTPAKENQIELRQGFEKLNELEVTTSYPLLLMLYDDYQNGRITSDDFASMLKLVETFIVRRAVCGVPTNALNRYLPTIYAFLDKNKMVESLRLKLKGGTKQQRMPDDNDFMTNLMTRKLYGDRTLRYVLEAIEHHNNKEPVKMETLQIEHIMPQTLTEEWKKQLGENYEHVHQTYLDTLGNLTLTGYNQEYSNLTFIEKRDHEKGYRKSGIQITMELAKFDKWTEQEITERAKNLAIIALDIWKM
ncbi:MAG: DUF262 domain-containing protein [Candidatus Bathyarchaeia archaeon]